MYLAKQLQFFFAMFSTSAHGTWFSQVKILNVSSSSFLIFFSIARLSKKLDGVGAGVHIFHIEGCGCQAAPL